MERQKQWVYAECRRRKCVAAAGTNGAALSPAGCRTGITGKAEGNSKSRLTRAGIGD